jgi:hypothetical protein
MTAKQIQQILTESKMQKGIVAQNYYLGGFEADLLHILEGKLYEYEIKVSRSDFFKDFEKKDKHEKLQAGKLANKFYFVVPTCLVKIAEVPAQYGLIYVNEQGKISTVKRAKELHKEKVGEAFYTILARNFMFRLIAEKAKNAKLLAKKYGKQLEL